MKNEKLTLALRINAAFWLLHGVCPIPVWHLDKISRSFLREWWADIAFACWLNTETKDWAPLAIPSWIPETAKLIANNWRIIL